MTIKLLGPLEMTIGERQIGAGDLGGIRPKQVLEILLAEPIHSDGGLGVPEGSAVITLAKRHLRGVHPRLEDPTLVDTAELERPLRIRLVI